MKGPSGEEQTCHHRPQVNINFWGLLNSYYGTRAPTRLSAEVYTDSELPLSTPSYRFVERWANPGSGRIFRKVI